MSCRKDVVIIGLQLWLPLNGDVKNYGLCNAELSYSNLSFEDSGKIGKCLSTGGIVMSAETAGKILNNNAITISLWLYVNAPTGSDNKAMIFGNNEMANNNNRKFSLFQYPTCNDFHYCWMNDTSGDSGTFRNGVVKNVFPSYQWTHIAVTYENPNICVYINGELKHTSSGVSNSASFHYATNVIHNSPYHKVNDFRLYDECLSPKQIKYISQAMICHYPMGNVDGKIGGRNLLKQYIRVGNRASKIDNLSINIGVGSSVGDTYFYLKSWLPLTGGEIYTISCDAENVPSGAPNWIFGVRNQESLFNININKNGRCYGTGVLDNDIAADAEFILDDRNRLYTAPPNIKLSNFKLEKGNIATPWTPAPEDNSQFYDNIIPDISGYRNNATVKDSTCPAWSNDSPRYLGGYKFDATKEMFLNPIVFSGFSDSYTFSWWGKNSQPDSSMYWGFTDGNRLNLYYNDGYLFWNTGDGRSNSFEDPNDPVTTNKASFYTDGKWHHYCITGDGASNKLYIDGKIYGIAEIYRKITGTEIHINGFDDSDSYKINGNISDFRIYATALSESDVLNLYQSSASLDSQGNLMLAGEVIE